MESIVRKHMDTLPRGMVGDYKLFAMLLPDWIRKHKIPKDEQAVFEAREGKWYQRMLMDLEAKFGKEKVDLFLTEDIFAAALRR